MEQRTEILVDTTILIHHLRKLKKEDTHFIRAIRRFNNLYISVMTLYEVEFGYERDKRPSELSELLPFLKLLPIDDPTARQAASLHSDLIAQNKDIGIRDVFIASTALVHQLPLLTLNIKHFERVPALSLIHL
jgi:predicted nucleic acid-binding protein